MGLRIYRLNANLALSLTVFLSTLLHIELSSAAPNYVAPSETAVTTVTGKNVPLAGNKCVVCHRPAGPPLNSFGTDLKAVANNLGYGGGGSAGWVNTLPAGVTVATAFKNMFEGVAGEDSDNDKFDNKTELAGGSNPGDVASKPEATSNDGGSSGNSNGSGDTQILSPRNLDNGSSSGSTLSGCGQVAQLDKNRGFQKAELNKIWLFALLFMLPLAVLTVLREPKTRAVPIKKSGLVPPLEKK